MWTAWTVAEDELLRAGRAVRTEQADRGRRRRLNLPLKVPPWTNDEFNVLREATRSTLPTVAARLTHRTFKACRAKATKEGLIERSPRAVNMTMRLSWWKAEGRADRLLNLTRALGCHGAANLLGVSRNAVIGKLHRLYGSIYGPTTFAQPKVHVIGSLDSRDCRWPIGDPASDDFRFCGAEALIDRSYCVDHFRKAYRVINGRDVALATIDEIRSVGDGT